MNIINTAFPLYMKGNKKKFVKIIEILLTNALNETEKYGIIKVQMNFQEDTNLLFFCIQNTSSAINPDHSIEINHMLRKNNYNISMEFLNCLKNNDATLGLYNANESVKQNSGSMKYKYEQKKGTKVMFTFKLRTCDEHINQDS